MATTSVFILFFIFINIEFKFGMVVAQINPYDILKAHLNFKIRANFRKRHISASFTHIQVLPVLVTNISLQQILNANKKEYHHEEGFLSFPPAPFNSPT